jgi:hypothetical protein
MIPTENARKRPAPNILGIVVVADAIFEELDQIARRKRLLMRLYELLAVAEAGEAGLLRARLVLVDVEVVEVVVPGKNRRTAAAALVTLASPTWLLQPDLARIKIDVAHLGPPVPRCASIPTEPVLEDGA